jgi:hypothetical protein
MPHIWAQYSANLDAVVVGDRLLDCAHEAALAGVRR